MFVLAPAAVPPVRRRVHSFPMALGSPATFSARIRFEFPASQFFISLERVQYIVDGSVQDEKAKGTEPLEVVTAVWSGMCMFGVGTLFTAQSFVSSC